MVSSSQVILLNKNNITCLVSLRTLFFIILCIGLLSSSSFAETKSTIQIVHSGLQEKDLKVPGEKITLKLSLQGTRYFDYVLRVLINRDGNFMDLMVREGTLSIHDVPEYYVKVHAPRHTIDYQFFLYDKKGSLVAQSQEYRIARQCTPALSLNDLSDIPWKSAPTEAEQLALKANVFERQLAAYSEAIELLEELDLTLNKATSERRKNQ
jgi:hypothetical protein